MSPDDVKALVSVRARSIRLFEKLEGKNEPTATVLQSDVAYEVEAIIRMIDRILEGKVEFK